MPLEESNSQFKWHKVWGFASTELWRRVVRRVLTEVSKEQRGFIFKTPEVHQELARFMDLLTLYDEDTVLVWNSSKHSSYPRRPKILTNNAVKIWNLTTDRLLSCHSLTDYKQKYQFFAQDAATFLLSVIWQLELSGSNDSDSDTVKVVMPMWFTILSHGQKSSSTLDAISDTIFIWNSITQLIFGI